MEPSASESTARKEVANIASNLNFAGLAIAARVTLGALFCSHASAVACFRKSPFPPAAELKAYLTPRAQIGLVGTYTKMGRR